MLQDAFCHHFLSAILQKLAKIHQIQLQLGLCHRSRWGSFAYGGPLSLNAFGVSTLDLGAYDASLACRVLPVLFFHNLSIADVASYHELHSWQVKVFKLTESVIQWHRQQVAQLYIRYNRLYDISGTNILGGSLDDQRVGFLHIE